MKNKFHRIFALFFAFAVCSVSLFALIPASNAVIVDPQTKILSWDVHQNSTDLEYLFSDFAFEVVIFDASDNWRQIVRSSGSRYYDVPFVPGHRYRIVLCPLGYRGSYHGITLDNFPSQCNLQFSFGFTYENGEDTGYASIVDPSLDFYWYEAGNNTPLRTDSDPLIASNGKTEILVTGFDFSRVEGADIVNFEFVWNNVSWESDPVPTGIYIDHFLLTATVDNQLLYDNFDKWGNADGKLYNELTTALGYRDDILGGWAPPILPPFSGSVEDVEDLETDIMDYLNDGFGDFGDLLSGFATVVLNVGPSLAFISWILTRISGIRFFSVIISTVCALGLTAFVLNLVVSISTRYRNKGGDS